jgi:hypothetical protein
MSHSFVDHDMFTRFTGGGIGHLSTRNSTRGLEDEIRDLWGTLTTPENLNNESSSDKQSQADLDTNNEDELLELDIEDPDAFISRGLGLESSLLEEEDWYTDQESDGLENDQADDGECVEDKSALRYEL